MKKFAALLLTAALTTAVFTGMRRIHIHRRNSGRHKDRQRTGWRCIRRYGRCRRDIGWKRGAHHLKGQLYHRYDRRGKQLCH